MGKLKPKFTLVGSIAEGTRLGLANELDLSVKFYGWPEGTFRIQDNIFNLKRTENTPEWMKDFFDSSSYFRLNQFKYQFLKAIEKALEQVEIPSRLRLVTTNEDFRNGKSKCRNDCSKRLTECQEGFFKQCKHCAVAVSQTKVGPCLQFEYSGFNLPQHGLQDTTVYCSVDLIPMFNIEEMEAMALARIGNQSMLKYRPMGWFKYFMGYAMNDKVTQALAKEVGIETIKTVSVKTMNCNRGINYYVRPGQVLGPEKFIGEDSKKCYLDIKFLSKVIKADLNMYWVKKELRLLKEIGWGGAGTILFKSKFRRELEDKVDYKQWEKNLRNCHNLHLIPLK